MGKLFAVSWEGDEMKRYYGLYIDKELKPQRLLYLITFPWWFYKTLIMRNIKESITDITIGIGRILWGIICLIIGVPLILIFEILLRIVYIIIGHKTKLRFKMTSQKSSNKSTAQLNKNKNKTEIIRILKITRGEQ